MYTVSEKTSPYYICDNFFIRHPTLPILGRNIYPREFETNATT